MSPPCPPQDRVHHVLHKHKRTKLRAQSGPLCSWDFLLRCWDCFSPSSPCRSITSLVSKPWIQSGACSRCRSGLWCWWTGYHGVPEETWVWLENLRVSTQPRLSASSGAVLSVWGRGSGPGKGARLPLGPLGPLGQGPVSAQEFKSLRDWFLIRSSSAVMRMLLQSGLKKKEMKSKVLDILMFWTHSSQGTSWTSQMLRCVFTISTIC